MSKMSKEEAVQWYAHNRGLYKKLSEKIQNIITELLEEADITIHTITSRVKEVDSFRKKIDNPKYDSPVNQITDFSGIRIIAYVEDDLKPICKIIEDSFEIDIKNSTDKADELGTDRVGYKSIHYVSKIKKDRSNLPEYKKFKDLRFEIQIRTILQHAWAEIEHDKNYKFNGVLPSEIKRRFKILAGTLELVDREFNQLSQEIDKISKSVVEAERNDELSEIEINSTTLKSYLSNQFKDFLESNMVLPDIQTEVFSELKDFGVETLNDFKKIIPDSLKETLSSILERDNDYTFTGLIRMIMMIDDCDKYLKKSWKNHWDQLDGISNMILKKYIDVNDLFRKLDISVEG